MNKSTVSNQRILTLLFTCIVLSSTASYAAVWDKALNPMHGITDMKILIEKSHNLSDCRGKRNFDGTVPPMANVKPFGTSGNAWQMDMRIEQVKNTSETTTTYNLIGLPLIITRSGDELQIQNRSINFETEFWEEIKNYDPGSYFMTGTHGMQYYLDDLKDIGTGCTNDIPFDYSLTLDDSTLIIKGKYSIKGMETDEIAHSFIGLRQNLGYFSLAVDNIAKAIRKKKHEALLDRDIDTLTDTQFSMLFKQTVGKKQTADNQPYYTYVNGHSQEIGEYISYYAKNGGDHAQFGYSFNLGDWSKDIFDALIEKFENKTKKDSDYTEGANSIDAEYFYKDGEVRGVLVKLRYNYDGKSGDDLYEIYTENFKEASLEGMKLLDKLSDEVQESLDNRSISTLEDKDFIKLVSAEMEWLKDHEWLRTEKGLLYTTYTTSSSEEIGTYVEYHITNAKDHALFSYSIIINGRTIDEVDALIEKFKDKAVGNNDYDDGADKMDVGYHYVDGKIAGVNVSLMYKYKGKKASELSEYFDNIYWDISLAGMKLLDKLSD